MNTMVELRVQLPETVVHSFGEDNEVAARHLLESAAAEGYRSGRLSRHQVRQMLKLSWHQTEEFLKVHGCELRYTIEDLENDRRTIAKVFGS